MLELLFTGLSGVYICLIVLAGIYILFCGSGYIVGTLKYVIKWAFIIGGICFVFSGFSQTSLKTGLILGALYGAFITIKALIAKFN